MNIPFSATLALSTCEITGVPTKGVLSIVSGTAGALSGNFFYNGNSIGEGSYQFTAASGIFANVDPGGYFYSSLTNNKLSVYLYTPEPASVALIGFGFGVLALFERKRRSAAPFHMTVKSLW